MNICYVISSSLPYLPKTLFEKLKKEIYNLVVCDRIEKFIFSSVDTFPMLFYDALSELCDLTWHHCVPYKKVTLKQAINMQPKFCIAYDSIKNAERKLTYFKNAIMINLAE